MGKNIVKALEEVDASQRRFNEQLQKIIHQNKALRTIARCLKYNDRIPRKYRGLYNEVIGRMKLHRNKLKLN